MANNHRATTGNTPVGKPNKAKSPTKTINRVNVPEAVRLKAENGLSYREIAKLQGVSAPAIYQSIHDLLPDQETETYKNSRADIFAKAQKEIAKTINAEVIAGAGLGERTNALVKLHTAERLERGESTGLIGVGIGLSAPLQDAVDKIVSRLGGNVAQIEGNQAPLETAPLAST